MNEALLRLLRSDLILRERGRPFIDSCANGHLF
jgi:hypothetical protein